MEKKLQALLDKVYEEGVAKGQEVASAVIKDAERKAAKIREEAERDAAELRKRAQDDAEELKRNVASELKLSAEQALSALKQQISGLITSKAISEPIGQAFSDEAFLKDMILTLTKKWGPSENGSADLAVLLPPDQQEALQKYFSSKSKEVLDHGFRIDIDPQLEKGFRIGPADGSYVISFTDKDFETFFMDYLRPRTKALLFGEDE
jgi:V/A-type H+-transporting ATPase subunit E